MAALIAGATRTLYISRHSWPRLVEHGVGIYEYQPTMMHAKTVAADRVRSFEADIERSIRVLPATIASRGIANRAVDAICYWARAQL